MANPRLILLSRIAEPTEDDIQDAHNLKRDLTDDLAAAKENLARVSNEQGSRETELEEQLAHLNERKKGLTEGLKNILEMPQRLMLDRCLGC